MRLAAIAAVVLAVPGAAAEQLTVGGGTIDVTLARDAPAPLVLDWVRDSARAVSGYMDGFPVPHVRLTVRTHEGRNVRGGVTYGGRNPSIRISVGRQVDAADLRRDWVLVHEMMHLAFPDLTSNDDWAEEGLSTYAEPVARVRVGQMTDEKFWTDLVEGLPQGLPRGGRGLHGTREWGRTYWGGALFWLLADVRIREATRNAKGLEDALRGIHAAGGDIRAGWPLSRALEAGDRATGTTVLAKLYAELGTAPGDVSLDELWRKLGVKRAGRSVSFDDAAPLAGIRKAITARR